MEELHVLGINDAHNNEEIAALFHTAIDTVNNGTAKTEKIGYQHTIIADSQYISAQDLLAFKLNNLPAPSFDVDKEWDFINRLASLFDWDIFAHRLEMWIEGNLHNNWMTLDPTSLLWILKPGLAPDEIPPAFVDFACRIAGTYQQRSQLHMDMAEKIFYLLEKVGSDLPARFRKQVCADLPDELASHIDHGARISANDITGIISVEITEDSAQAYGTAIRHIIRLLTTTDFPRSYWIRYQGSGQVTLPIEGLPHADAHRFFAGAAEYSELHPLIAKYAEAASNELEYYTDPDLADEYFAAPGTFAVFSLAWSSQKYSPLLLEYLHNVDGEHQELHIFFVRDYLLKFGPTPESLAALCIASHNCQVFEHDNRFPDIVAHQEALKTLLTFLGAPRENVESTLPEKTPVSSSDNGENSSPIKGMQIQRLLQNSYYAEKVRYALWGEDGENGGEETLASAPEDLRPLYEKIFSL